MRPCVSVAGTRCTRWPPDSNFSFEYAPLPIDAGDDFLVAAQFAFAGGDDLDLPALALGIARCTCGTGRRRTAPTRRRRCRRGFPGTRCARRWGPWAAAVSAARPRAFQPCALPPAISSSAKSFISGSAEHFLRRRQCRSRLAGRRDKLDHRRDFGMLARRACGSCPCPRVASSAGQQAIEFFQALRLRAGRSFVLRSTGFITAQESRRYVDTGWRSRAAICSRSSLLALIERVTGRVQQLVGEAWLMRFQHLLRVFAARQRLAAPVPFRDGAAARHDRAVRGWSAPPRAFPASA